MAESSSRDRSPLLPVGMVVVAMASIQVGSAVAKRLFPLVGSTGAASLRLLLAAIILALVLRAWRLRLDAAAWRIVLVYGAALGGMNTLFYAAIGRIPLGVAVALEITGPLAVAVFSSRRALDLVWVALAAVGLFLLLPIAGGSTRIDLAGAAYALGAGACWALYIVFGKRAGTSHGLGATALAMVVGAALVLPLGVAQAGTRLFAAEALPVALAVAVLSTAFPYSLEMVALRRLPTRTFGTLMSLQPAFAALSGIVLLGERLSALQWSAIAAIVGASVGTTVSSVRQREQSPVSTDPTVGVDPEAGAPRSSVQ